MSVHTVGIECEIDGVPIHNMVQYMVDHNMWLLDADDERSPHYNHCDCEACEWGSSPFRAHYDCTCDGEIVSDVMSWPSDRTVGRLTQLQSMLSMFGVQPGSRAGFHVHVGHLLNDPSDDFEDDEYDSLCSASLSDNRLAQRVVDYFTWYEAQFAVFAKQTMPCVRSYNQWLSAACRIADADGASATASRVHFRKHEYRPEKGMTLALRPRTWEFRIWNSTVDAWRMYMAIDMSCAFLDAVANAPAIADKPPFDRPPLITFIAPYLTDAGLAYAMRHLVSDNNS